jgi:hypothetical protein
MEFWIAILSCIGALVKPIKDIKRDMTNWDNFWNIIQIISILTLCGLVCFISCSNKEKIKIERIKCNRALSSSCDGIISRFYKYNNIKKTKGKNDAIHTVGIAFQMEGANLKSIYDQYKEYIDSTKSKAIIDAWQLLSFRSEDIVKDNYLIRYLYSDICKIDSTFKEKKPFYDLLEK